MYTVKVRAYAKINLTLDVTGVKDGFHLLDSFVASLDLFDLIVAKKRRDSLASVTMHGMDSEGIPPERNNALRAAEAFIARFGCSGADITVYKNIPVGAGLGGSSADAAGTLNALAKLYGVEDRAAIGEIADSLGSDTRYMLRGGFCRMRGRGENLEFLDGKNRLYFLLICPKTSVSSGECYRRYDARFSVGAGETVREGGDGENTPRCIRAYLDGNAAETGRYVSNALYSAAADLNGDVARALEEARSFSPLGAAMTGSGSCVFALFENRELCDWAKSRYRGKYRTYVAGTVLPERTESARRVNGGKGKTNGVWLRSPFALSEEEIAEASDGGDAEDGNGRDSR